ncbi:ParA family protein [Corallococcus llansteffanensis]|uniref:ParA family protein n=1 Tax=Corallococcus llansteffanensis TaxID=2316731 RepID=A0A3A8PRR4_9BACT|nr:ParA family protein [Corallococcus llansteffanensis]RKH59053.1 ParA family protein [Corallococcus llansteffanensis]
MPPAPITATTRPQYPRVISVVNLKGGVGKTTLCVNLAYGLAYFKDKRVLLIDLDPQANATQYLISQHTYQKLYLSNPPPKATIVEAYDEFVQATRNTDNPPKDPDRYIQKIYRGEKGYLDLVASKLELSLLAFEGGQVHKNNQVRWLIESVQENYDIVLIDCPPTVSRMLMGGFEASDHVLVPMKPEFLSTIGLPLLHRTITKTYNKEISKRADFLNKELSVIGIVYTMSNASLTMAQESMSEIQREAARHKYPIFDSTISQSTKFTWSAKRTLPIFRTEPSSRYASEIERLVNEFLARLPSAASNTP